MRSLGSILIATLVLYCVTQKLGVSILVAAFLYIVFGLSFKTPIRTLDDDVDDLIKKERKK